MVEADPFGIGKAQGGRVPMGHGTIVAATHHAIWSERDDEDFCIRPPSNKDSVIPVRHILGIGNAIGSDEAGRCSGVICCAVLSIWPQTDLEELILKICRDKNVVVVG